MDNIKNPTNYREQVDILMSRGLTIDNVEYAEKILSRVSYYRLTGYLYQYKYDQDNYKFPEGFTFESVYKMYSFDVRLRNILLYIFEEIEIILKTRIAYIHADIYGALGYKDGNNFRSKQEHNVMVKMIDSSIERNKSIKFVKHHTEKYDSQFPIWVIIELFTFGMIDKFYSNINSKEQKVIAKSFGILPDNLKGWLQLLTHCRNLAAHYMRLYNYNFPYTPNLKIKNSPRIEASHKVFDVLYISKFIYQDVEQWNTYVLENISSLLEKYDDCIDLEYIGFDENWRKNLKNI